MADACFRPCPAAVQAVANENAELRRRAAELEAELSLRQEALDEAVGMLNAVDPNEDSAGKRRCKMDAIDLSDRDFLQRLRTAARARAENVPNSSWRRVYLRLADAAGELDAYLARSSVEHTWSLSDD